MPAKLKLKCPCCGWWVEADRILKHGPYEPEAGGPGRGLGRGRGFAWKRRKLTAQEEDALVRALEKTISMFFEEVDE